MKTYEEMNAIEKANVEIDRAHWEDEKIMSVTDMMADIRRQKRELKDTAVYEIPQEEMRELRKIITKLWKWKQATEKAPLEIPFTSVNTREREFQRSKDYPNEYYNFKYFGVRITIWKHDEDDYSLATIGWYPKHKRFEWRRGYAGKYAYYNRCNDLETAIVDWLLAIADFFTSEMGIYLDKQGRLELEERNGTMGAFEHGLQKS